jgi:hypothetical protein
MSRPLAKTSFPTQRQEGAAMAIDYHRRIASPSPASQVWERLLAFLRGPEAGDRDEGTADFEAVLSAPAPPQFPIVARGYDRAAVDQSIAELQLELAEADRELAEARNRLDAADEVPSELKRIGEQTSSVLIAAYEQRDAILREAREEAKSAVAEAGAKASALVADGETRLQELKTRTEAVQRERDRLLGELHAVSSGLAAVVESVEQAPPA